MPYPPLRSRLLASCSRPILLVLLLVALTNQHIAWATELDEDGKGASIIDGEDHNWHRIGEDGLWQNVIAVDREQGIVGSDSFPDEGEKAAGRLYGRQSSSTDIVGNDTPNYKDIKAGETAYWVYPKDLLQKALAQSGKGLPGPIPIISASQTQVEREHADLRRRDGMEDAVEERELSAEYRKRQSGAKQVFISINTCTQPTWQGPGIQREAPPQLTMYVSTTDQSPGPGRGSNITLVEGYANFALDASDAVHLSIVAPELPSGFQGSWSYELAVSLNDYYHGLGTSDQFLYLIDTDTHGALLVTGNLTDNSPPHELYQKWLNFTPPPFTILASEMENTSYMGLNNSFCGLRSATTIQGDPEAPPSASNPVQMGMINRGIYDLPKQQFYMAGLNASSHYNGWVAMIGNGTASGAGVVGGGGVVWPQTANWTTKTDGNCKLVYNLTFCDQVAYAAPTNPETFSDENVDELRALYDGYAAEMYKGFNYSLQQVPCDTTSDARYSLVKSCTDCAAAYKEWLCAVTIPRCEDFSRNESWLQPRNMGQPFYNGTSLPDSLLDSAYVPMPDAPTLPGSPAFSQTYRTSNATFWSRNPDVIIDQIKPGPYREVKPCRDICYGLVQACPATFGFGCPLEGRGLEVDYGTREGNGNGNISCSYLGAVYVLSGAGQLTPNLWVLALVAGIAVFGVVLE